MNGFILVIDDNPIDIKVCTMTLERLGFSCLGFTEPAVAFEWLKSNTPKVILLDLQMPGVTGYELIPILRGLPNAASVPIVITSGKNQSEDVLKAINLGANDYIVKPVDALILQEKVEKLAKTEETIFYSFDLLQPAKAYFSRPVSILSVSEFGLKVSSPTAMKPGETIELTEAPENLFTNVKLFLRCLSCESISASEFSITLTYIGMTESQRQIIRKNCRQISVHSKKGAA